MDEADGTGLHRMRNECCGGVVSNNVQVIYVHFESAMLYDRVNVLLRGFEHEAWSIGLLSIQGGPKNGTIFERLHFIKY